MRRLLFGSLCIAACAGPGTPRATTAVAPELSRVQVDSFVLTVRDMGAWAIVTPAAHIPVGGLQDATGNVSSVTDNTGAQPVPTPDSIVHAFREALSAAARRQKPVAVGMAYLVRRIPPGGKGAVNAVLVEVESASGYRADVLWPYTTNDFGEPVFTRSYALPGSFRAFTDSTTKLPAPRR